MMNTFLSHECVRVWSIVNIGLKSEKEGKEGKRRGKGKIKFQFKKDAQRSLDSNSNKF